jgi:hypothetical protein
VQPEVIHLDDYIVSGFELDEDAAEIRLRRKPDMRDSLVFNIRRQVDLLLAEVHRPGEEESPDAPPTAVEPGDSEQLERLWQLLRRSVSDVLLHKDKLIAVHLDGEDVFDTDKVLPLVQRIVKHLAPTVAEIGKRSPNPAELSLKQESDKGRREEIYLRKQDLFDKLAPLSPKARAVFAPLALERVEQISDVDIVLEE